VRQDVLFHVDAGSNLNEFDSGRGALKHAAFGHIIDRLSDLGRVGAAERDLLHPVDEFWRFAFAGDGELAVREFDLQTASCKCSCE
jgi:hypothetical protein